VSLELRATCNMHCPSHNPYFIPKQSTNLCSLQFLLGTYIKIQGVPLDTEPGISLIILPLMRILQRNLNRSTFVVWEMKRNVSVVLQILLQYPH